MGGVQALLKLLSGGLDADTVRAVIKALAELLKESVAHEVGGWEDLTLVWLCPQHIGTRQSRLFVSGAFDQGCSELYRWTFSFLLGNFKLGNMFQRLADSRVEGWRGMCPHCCMLSAGVCVRGWCALPGPRPEPP